MKKRIILSTLLSSCLLASSAFATDLVCEVYPKNGGNQMGSGTSYCAAFDFSFGNSTSGKFYLKNISKPISQVIWNGKANCSGGTSCGVTVRAYSVTQASALVLYQDGTYEHTNTATMEYETGH